MEKKVIANFGDRFIEIMQDNKMEIKKLADDLGVSVSTIYAWRNNTNEPNLLKLIVLANYFKCSLEFLIGRSDEDVPTSGNGKSFITALRSVMKETGISTYKLKKISKFNGGYFLRWKRGAEPSLQTLIELSDIFGCTIDHLIGRE